MYFSKSIFPISTLVCSVLAIPAALVPHRNLQAANPQTAHTSPAGGPTCSELYGKVDSAAVPGLEAQIRAWPQKAGVIIIAPGGPDLKWVSGITEVLIEPVDPSLGTNVNVNAAIGVVNAINGACTSKGIGGAEAVGAGGPATGAFVLGVVNSVYNGALNAGAVQSA